MATVGVVASKTARAGERGSELLELAIVLPIFLVVIAAVVDFGFLFQRYEVVTNAAREGARLGSLPSYSDPAIVTTRVKLYLQDSGLNPLLATIDVPPPYLQAVGGGQVLMIKVSVQYPTDFGFLGPIATLVGGSGFGTLQLRATSVMRLEGGS